MLKISLRNICLLIFSAITIIYILTRWLIFKGFNGTDDLHYAMLAAKMTQGTYDPFQPGDIYSGRILLIASQAAIYKLAGINTITTQAGSMIVIILSCYLTVFKLLPVKDAANTLLASCLFYFNPVITYPAIGINGDAYLMLATIIICIIIRSWIFDKKPKKQSLLRGLLIALIAALSLLYKETSLVFIPFTCIVAYWYHRRNAWSLIASIFITFLLMIILYGWLYHYYTGNPFFKISQISNSHYFNHCSYDLLPFKYLAIRLTYGVWQEFITQGYYPVIFGASVAALTICKRRPVAQEPSLFLVLFSVLMITCLYFPFSFSGYQPLCSDPRQFMMVLPLGVIITAGFVNEHISKRGSRTAFIFISLIILVFCIAGTGNKWQWMIYSLLFLFTISLTIEKIAKSLKYSAVAFILWISIFEHLFYKNSHWFYDMVQVKNKVNSTYYYFPEHDNMMNWQLLHEFDKKKFAFYNLEKHPFKIFEMYYQQPDSVSFHPGWLIINKAYTVRSSYFFQKIDSLQNAGYFKKQVIVGDISALMIDTPERFFLIRSLILEDE